MFQVSMFKIEICYKNRLPVGFYKGLVNLITGKKPNIGYFVI